MADKLLICVSAEQVTACIAHNRKLGVCQSFGNDAQGAEAFGRHLESVKAMPTLVMVDTVEEDYRFEMLPHASGRDRADLLSRRLRQLYRNTAFCSYIPQGRDTGKRRDDQYLFFALTNPDLVDRWLASLRAHDFPVAGVFLLPTVTQALAHKIAPAATNLLLVSHHPSGIRLTFFRQGRLRVSRLTPVESADPRGLAAYTEEIANTRLYLHALRVMTLDEHMDVRILDREGSLAGLEQSVAIEVSNVQATLLNAADIAATVGIPAAVVRDVPDALFLHYLAQHPPVGNLAPEQVTEPFQIYQLRRALFATTAIAAAASLTWGGLNAYQIHDLRSQRALAAAQTADYQRRYQEVTRGFPAIPTSTDNLVLAVQTADRLIAARRNPERAMVAISRALERFPGVWLKSFGWQYAPRDFDAGSGARSADGAGNAGAAPRPPGSQNSRHQSAYIEAEIRPFQGDYRAAIGEINGFMETLSQDPLVAEVRPVALPLNVSSNMALAGSTTDSGVRATSAAFRLNLRLKPEQ